MISNSVVFDVGQFSTKVGFGGSNEPQHTFYSITGVPKYKSIELSKLKQIYVGNEVAESIGLYKVSFPIDKGEIIDWEMYEALLDYAFYLLRIDPTTVNVLFTINTVLSDASQRRLFKLFLEKYQVLGYYPVRDALLTMYSGGFNTGLVVDIGASQIRITPIYEGFILKHAIQMINIGGTTIDAFMRQRLSRLGVSSDSSGQKELVRTLKEKACFISLNLDEDQKHPQIYEEEYKLPDGSSIKISEDRFWVPEILFKPQLFNLECDPLHLAILNAVDLCDIDIRRQLLQKIFLTGGSSMFPQLEQRLTQELLDELNRRGKQQQEIHIIAPQERVFANWIGGSILVMLPDFQKSWVTRQYYFQNGVPENLIYP